MSAAATRAACCAAWVRASPVAGLGSKLGIDATHKWPAETSREWGRGIAMSSEVKARIDALWGSLGL